MRFRSAIETAAVILLLGMAAAWGQSRVRIVTISVAGALAGNGVQEKLPLRPGTSAKVNAWAQASRNAPVIEGETLRTSGTGFAEVDLECGSALRLAPNSEMAFNQLQLSPNGVPITTVTLEAGEAFFSMQNADVPDFHARVPGGVLSMPEGGANLRLEVPRGRTDSVAVLHGQILVEAGGQTARVKARRQFEFLPGGGINLVVMEKPDLWQKWSQREDAAFHREVLAQETVAAPQNLNALVPAPVAPVPAGAMSPEPEVILGPILGAMQDMAHARKQAASVPYCAQR